MFSWFPELFFKLKDIQSFKLRIFDPLIYVEVVRYVNLSRWRKILWPTLWSDTIFAPTRIYVEIVLYINFFLRHLGIYFLLLPARIVFGCETQMGIPFEDSSSLLLVPRNYFRWDPCWNFPAGALELIPFGSVRIAFVIYDPWRFLLWGSSLFSPVGVYLNGSVC